MVFRDNRKYKKIVIYVIKPYYENELCASLQTVRLQADAYPIQLGIRGTLGD